MLSVCLCVIGLSYWTAAEHVTVTPEYKKLFIDTHNKIRREVGSSNMQYLEWDDNLAAEAADWASRCHFYHKNGQGENLAYNTNKMTEVELIKDAMNMWYEEKNDYSYNSLSCSGICSHYTNHVTTVLNIDLDVADGLGVVIPMPASCICIVENRVVFVTNITNMMISLIKILLINIYLSVNIFVCMTDPVQASLEKTGPRLPLSSLGVGRTPRAITEAGGTRTVLRTSSFYIHLHVHLYCLDSFYGFVCV
ncbi:hypothetical protein FSP39_004238 [Pinctada imbricata]|uniref:SCP domain-containing protein n=1 Tax=Pinctada imbricata TaxID=66713 RepID=A0AA88XW06_PINIB|nr:hypothetical protein FSP39_004238 [Pinctada imbricata]